MEAIFKITPPPFAFMRKSPRDGASDAARRARHHGCFAVKPKPVRLPLTFSQSETPFFHGIKSPCAGISPFSAGKHACPALQHRGHQRTSPQTRFVKVPIS